MNGKYKIINHDCYVEIRFSRIEDFSPEMILEIFRKNSHLFMNEHGNFLWDFRKCNLQQGFDGNAVKKIINFIEESNEILWGEKVAILVKTKQQEELSQLYSIYTAQYPTFTEVFTDGEFAVEWLEMKC